MAAHISVFTNLMEVLFVVVGMAMYSMEMEKVAIVSFHQNCCFVFNFGKFKFCEHTTVIGLSRSLYEQIWQVFVCKYSYDPVC